PGELFELSRVGDVAADGEGAPAEGANLGGRRFDLLLGARGAHDVTAHLCDGERDRLSDAATRARYDCDLVRHLEAIEQAHGRRDASERMAKSRKRRPKAHGGPTRRHSCDGTEG